MRVLQLRPKLMPHQVEFVMDDTTPIQGFVGGYRAGKTEAAVWKCIRCAAEVFPGEDGVFLAPIAGMNQRNAVPIFRRLMPTTGLKYDIEALSNKRVEYFDIEVGSKVSRIWLGISAENYTRMNGMSLAWGGFDEADLCRSAEVAYDAFVELGNRLSESPGAIQFAVSTPEGYGFMYRRWVEEASEKTKIWHVDMRDNFLLPPGYIESRLENIPASKQKAYIEGQFANIYTSTVYSDYDRNLNDSDLTIEKVDQYVPLHIGMDFNIDHMAAVVHVVVNNEPHAVDELCEVKDTATMITAIKKRYPGRQIIVYPDASAKNRNPAGLDTSMQLLRNAGFKVVVNAANPAVGDRINSMNAMFLNAAGQRRYKVNSRMCPTYVKCLERQAWIKGEPDKSNNVDHPLDAAGYFIVKVYPLRGRPTARTMS